MIECCRCHCEIIDKLVECADVIIVENDLTEVDPEADIWRFCRKCWQEMINFLNAEGQLKL